MSSQDQEIQSLLRRIAEHDDEKAFSIFFDRYHTRLLRFANLYVRSVEEAEDVVSEVMIKLLKKRNEFFSRENFIGYLFQSVRNKCKDHLKLEKKRMVVFDINYNEKDYFLFDHQTPVNRLLHSELSDLLKKRIEDLPPKRRLAFKLVKDENMSYKQVAELMNISERTVEVHLKLAIKDIKEALNIYLDQSYRVSKDIQEATKIISLLLISLSI